MDTELQIRFKSIVEQIFSNWSALQLAVEHGMAGSFSRQIALQSIDHICNYCLSENDIQSEDICDELEDIMDEEFNTICEDGSPKQVSEAIWRFLQILKVQNLEQLQLEMNNLPPIKNWLIQPQTNVQMTQNNESSDDEDDKGTNQDKSMDVDPEWTVVKGRRKK